jgi:ABC-type multidrug transport system ATPase subunit
MDRDAAPRAGGNAAGDGAVLALERVTRTFGDVMAVASLSLEVAAGEVVGLLGHNGAGKTTTVRLLAGLLEPDVGRVRVLGLDPIADGTLVRQQLGVLPADPVVDARLTGRANLRFAADVFGLEHDHLDDRIEAALARFELADRGGERVDGYSTGMRQRLSLARILLPSPRVLLLDEPTAALDPVAARQVRRAIAGFARDEDRTVVLCTHDLAEAEQLCDRVLVLEHGQAVVEGSPAELAAQHGTGGVLLEVQPHDVERTVAIVASVAGVDAEVEPGGRVRAAGVAREHVPVVVRAVTETGIDLFEVRRLDPTLEEVYLALHAREDMA